MQILLTRQEIRRQVRAMLGQQTTEGTAAGDLDQLNAFIDAASIKAHIDCKWILSERRATVALGMEQYQIAYPADTGVGSVLEVGVWDEDVGEYLPLEQRILPSALDLDKLVAAGGEAFQRVQARPRFYQQRADGIFLWPPNDQTARDLRLAYHVRKTFLNDQQTSTVDAMLIIYWTLSLKRDSVGDVEGRQFAQGLYADQKAKLMGWANTGRAVQFNQAAVIGDREDDPTRPRPNYDTRPRVV